MTPEIPPDLIEHLISIGRSEEFGRLDRIAADFPTEYRGGFMRLRPDPWIQVANGLDEESLTCLIKSLTVLEKLPDFKAGSVSPVIWLFRCLPHPDHQAELVDWVMSHTENPYVPFGRSNHGAKCLTDYQQSSTQIEDHRRATQKAEIDRQTSARKRKAEQASGNLFAALRRKDEKAIRALLARGADPASKNEAGQSIRPFAGSLGLDYLLDTDGTDS
jgi:hypothetical protein